MLCERGRPTTRSKPRLWLAGIFVLVSALAAHCGDAATAALPLPVQQRRAMRARDAAAMHRSIQALNSTLNLLLQMNASCDAAVASACERPVAVADVFGSRTRCEEYLLEQQAAGSDGGRSGGAAAVSASGGGWCPVQITSCNASLPAWQTECFHNLVHCNISVRITYGHCPMAEMFQHQQLHRLHGVRSHHPVGRGRGSSGGGGGEGFVVAATEGSGVVHGSEEEYLVNFLRDHPVVPRGGQEAPVLPRSGVDVVDEAMRARLGCTLLFHELCTRPVALRARAAGGAGMTAANCSAALQLGAPQARVAVCKQQRQQQQRGDAELWCNDTVPQWRADCHDSLESCRTVAAAAHPDRCDRETLAVDAAILRDITQTEKLEAVLAALVGPNATMSTKWAMAKNSANANVLAEEGARLKAKRKEAMLAAKPSLQAAAQRELDRIDRAFAALASVRAYKSAETHNISTWLRHHHHHHRNGKGAGAHPAAPPAFRTELNNRIVSMRGGAGAVAAAVRPAGA